MMAQNYRFRISIGVPVYNGARFIAETLDSLLRQTYEDFELIICDNASTDGTEEICRAYEDTDKRVRYYRNLCNAGAAKNYRKTFLLSSGEYFRWANCDDLFAPQSLARCIEVLDHEPLVVLTYPKTKFIDDQGGFISDYEGDLHLQNHRASERFMQVLQRLGRVNGIYGLVRADILMKTKLIRNFVGGDVPLMAELSLYGKFWKIPEVLFFRRIHESAYSGQTKIEEQQGFFDPRTKGSVPLVKWRHLMAHLDSVRRAPLNAAEKIRIGCFLLRAGLWDRKKLACELSEAFRWAVRKSFLRV